jgi:hypothetical protein
VSQQPEAGSPLEPGAVCQLTLARRARPAGQAGQTGEQP